MSLLIKALKQAERDNRGDLLESVDDDLGDSNPSGTIFDEPDPTAIVSPEPLSEESEHVAESSSAHALSLEDLPANERLEQNIEIPRRASHEMQSQHEAAPRAETMARDPAQSNMVAADVGQAVGLNHDTEQPVTAAATPAPLPELSPVESRPNSGGDEAKALPLTAANKSYPNYYIWGGLALAAVAVAVWLYLQAIGNTMPDVRQIDGTVVGEPAMESTPATPGESSPMAGADVPTPNSDQKSTLRERPSVNEKPDSGVVQTSADVPIRTDPNPKKASDKQPTGSPLIGEQSTPTPKAKSRTRPTRPREKSIARRVPRAPTVRFDRTKSVGERKFALLSSAYSALLNGDANTARAAYRQALGMDRNLSDAWIGLAALAARNGDTVTAARHYRKALQINPNDTTALAGLATLSTEADQVTQESRLRNLAASKRSGPAVQFALASNLAAQGRWVEAQQAYFKASSADPTNPDYAFNLAVSLERIRQPRAAVDHYRRALRAAKSRPARFDLTQAQSRISALANDTFGSAQMGGRN